METVATDGNCQILALNFQRGYLLRDYESGRKRQLQHLNGVVEDNREKFN
jgi:hypothetical protein